MKELIKNEFNKYGFVLNERQIEQFEIYLNFLTEENEKYNLTAIIEPKEIVLKHFIDSLLGMDKIPQNAKIIDVGSGAGFPGVPIKIMRGDVKVTLIDSLTKRINFLKELITKLELQNIKARHIRAEDYAHKEGREKFDLACARAVAALPTLAEYLIPLVKQGGKIFMYKGLKSDEELQQGQKAIMAMGGKVERVLTYNYDEIGTRNIIIINKISATPEEYPRGKNLPKIRPIL